MGLNFSKNEPIYPCTFYFRIKEFYSTLCIFGKTWLYVVLHDINLTYYIPALFLVLSASYYSQNYADILASPLNVSKWYFLKYQMCRKGWFLQSRSHITIYHTAIYGSVIKPTLLHYLKIPSTHI